MQTRIKHPDADLTDSARTAIAAGCSIDRRLPSNYIPRTDGWVGALSNMLGIAASDVQHLAHQSIKDAIDGEDLDLLDPSTWRLGSHLWQQLQDASTGGPPTEICKQPIGLLVQPASNDSWVTRPVFSVAALRQLHHCGFHIGKDLNRAWGSRPGLRKFAGRINVNWLTTGQSDWSKVQPRVEGLKQFGLEGTDLAGISTDHSPAGQWVSLRVSDRDGQLSISVQTRERRAYPAQRFGTGSVLGCSAPQDLGEVVSAAAEIGLPAVLTSESRRQLTGRTRVGRCKGLPGQITITRVEGDEAVTTTMPALKGAAHLLQLNKTGKETIAVSKEAAVVLQMAAAKPMGSDPMLLPPQRKVAGVLVKGSAVNASGVGTGKTVITGRALNWMCQAEKRFRALILVPRAIEQQWVRQLEHGDASLGEPLTPTAKVVRLDPNQHSDIDRKLLAYHRQAGDQPLLVVCSHQAAEGRAAQLSVIGWQVMVVDEGHKASNPASELFGGLMQLRRKARQCWVLTGTPVGKSTSQLDVLVGLALNDPSMVEGRIASRLAGESLDDRNAGRLMAAYGETVQRVRSTEMEQYKPKMGVAKPFPIEADPNTQELLNEIVAGGRRAYKELRTWLKEVKTLRDSGAVSDELYQQALGEWRRAQATVLSVVGVLHDCSVDPEVLLESQAQLAVGARELACFKPALNVVDGMPLVRATVIDQLRSVIEDVPVVVAAERVRPLKLLSRSLATLGIDAPVLSGSLKADEMEDAIARFNGGDVPLLLLGPVGQTGLDLQHSGAMCHLDVPYSPDKLSQRLGRVHRPGSKHQVVHQFIPFLTGGIIPHQVALLAPRTARNHMLLDGITGGRAADTAEGAALAEISELSVDIKLEEGREETGLKLQIAAALFR